MALYALTCEGRSPMTSSMLLPECSVMSKYVNNRVSRKVKETDFIKDFHEFRLTIRALSRLGRSETIPNCGFKEAWETAEATWTGAWAPSWPRPSGTRTHMAIGGDITAPLRHFKGMCLGFRKLWIRDVLLLSGSGHIIGISSPYSSCCSFRVLFALQTARPRPSHCLTGLCEIQHPRTTQVPRQEASHNPAILK